MLCFEIISSNLKEKIRYIRYIDLFCFFNKKNIKDFYYIQSQKCFMKTKEFYELKLGQLTIEEYVNKFLDLLIYVPYIKAKKAKVQRFISGLPKEYRNIIEFDEPKTLEDTIRKATYCHEQYRHRAESRGDWKQKSRSRFQKKGIKSSGFKNDKNPRMNFPDPKCTPTELSLIGQK
jgi:hypothetical protein